MSALRKKPGRLQRYIGAIRRPWRRVPALDGLSDDEGRALAEGLRAQLREPGEEEAGWLGGPAGSFAVLLAGAVLTQLLFQSLESLVMLVGGVIGLFALMLGIHNTVPNQVASRLREDWCQGCAYPLYELPPADGPIECPRCRRPCIAPESIKSAADVLACDVIAHTRRARQERRRLTTVVERCGCGYPLRGLPVADRTAACPECGERYLPHSGGSIKADDGNDEAPPPPAPR